MALACGVPWVRPPWGRAELIDGALITQYRYLSANAAFVFVASVVAARARVLPRLFLGVRFVRLGPRFIAAFLALNTMMNLMSNNPVERWGFGAITAFASVLCVIVARSPAADRPVDRSELPAASSWP